MRLDVVLFKQYSKFSRSFLQKFIKRVGVRVNGRLVKKPHNLVKPGDKISVSKKDFDEFLAAQTASSASGTRLNFDKSCILYSGKKFLVIDKPPFICTERAGKGFFLVHRLDKDTSGVLVLARDQVTQAALQNEWQLRRVKKTYIALVKGEVKPERGAIEAGILRSIHNRRKMAVSSSQKAREASTEYEVIKYFPAPSFCSQSLTLLKAFPRTGRTHQIRVHFSSIGYPIIGDGVYGDKKINRCFKKTFGLKRQFLHAAELCFRHPVTKKRVSFKAKLPRDLENIVKMSARSERWGVRFFTQ